MTPVPIDRVITAAQRIDELLSGLATNARTLYYSANVLGNTSMDFRFDGDLDIKQLLYICKQRFAFLARERDINVRIETVANLVKIRGDREKIELAFSNLIHNAIKFSHFGREVLVTAHYLPDVKRVRVAVSNLGFGIPIDEKNKIFRGFVRSHIKDPRRPIPGTGVGLMITKRCIEGHGGTIRVTSKREKREYYSDELKNPSDWEGFHTVFIINLPTTPTGTQKRGENAT